MGLGLAQSWGGHPAKGFAECQGDLILPVKDRRVEQSTARKPTRDTKKGGRAKLPHPDMSLKN